MSTHGLPTVLKTFLSSLKSIDWELSLSKSRNAFLHTFSSFHILKNTHWEFLNLLCPSLWKLTKMIKSISDSILFYYFYSNCVAFKHAIRRYTCEHTQHRSALSEVPHEYICKYVNQNRKDGTNVISRKLLLKIMAQTIKIRQRCSKHFPWKHSIDVQVSTPVPEKR